MGLNVAEKSTALFRRIKARQVPGQLRSVQLPFPSAFYSSGGNLIIVGAVLLSCNAQSSVPRYIHSETSSILP